MPNTIVGVPRCSPHEREQNPSAQEITVDHLTKFPIITIKGIPFLVSFGNLFGPGVVRFNDYENLDSLPELFDVGPEDAVTIDEVLAEFKNEELNELLNSSDGAKSRKELVVCQLLRLLDQQNRVSKRISDLLPARKMKIEEATTMVSQEFGQYEWDSWRGEFRKNKDASDRPHKTKVSDKNKVSRQGKQGKRKGTQLIEQE